MSGIEVAGLVLGAIPLVITGLEHYSEGVATIKIMFNAPSEFKSLGRRLTVEQKIFRNTIELLLHDIVDDDMLSEFMKDASNENLWSDPAVERALRNKLQSSYSVYLETIQSMDKTLNEFRSRLKLNDDGKGPFTADRKSFRDAYKRFQFGLKKSAYMDLVEEITKDNTALSKLTEQTSVLEPSRMSRRRLPNFEKIRTAASSMFSTLQKGLGSSCSGTHKASLYMKPVDDKERKRGSALDALDEVSFRVVLHHELGLQPQKVPLWAIEEAEIRLLDSITAKTAPTPAPDPVTLPQRPAKGKKMLRFKEPEPPQKSPPPKTAAQKDLEEIQDLCASIQRLQAMQCDICLGYLQDAANARRHGVFWPRKRLVDKSSFESLPLDAILSGQTKQTGAKLSVGDSRLLALSLAHGTLRLHDTPWLAKRWGRSDVTLLRQNGKILADHPFVSTNLQNPSTLQSSTRNKSSIFTSCAGVRNESLFALGVVLIELGKEKPFDQLSAPEDLNPDGTKHPASDFMTATRLLDDIYDKMGRKYGDAVRRCILCEFDHRKSSLEDDSFCKAVYDNVVLVLEEDVRQHFDR